MTSGQSVLLGEVAEIFNGKTPSKAEQRDSGFPVLKIKDVASTGMFRGRYESFVDVEFANKYQRKWVTSTDSLLLNAAHNASHVASKLYRVEECVAGALPTGEWTVVRPNEAKALPDFIFGWLGSATARRDIRSAVKGIHLYPKDVALIQLALPPLDEQRRIVAILNSAQRIRRLCREAIVQARELIPALFIQMFGDPAANPMGWPVVTMGTLVERMEGGKNIAAGSEDADEGSLRILKVSAVTSGVFNAKESKPAPDGFKPAASYFVRKGDLLFSRANTELLVGATALVESAPENILLPDKLWRFVWADKNVVEPYYMLHYLKAPTTRQEISKRATGTSGSMKNISQAKLMTLPVIVPPFATQKIFATRVTEIQSLIIRLEQQAADADALLQSLMSRFFD